MTLDDAIGSEIRAVDPFVAAEAERVRRRALGAYYTPDHLSAVVAEWAIRSANDRILEPGFGGCGFLTAAKNRLVQLGQDNAHDFIHGCDIDKAAFGYLRETFGTDSTVQHFPHVDFLDTRAGQTWEGARFNVALGNPPYVSYQALGENRAKYQATINASEWQGLSARASLWAYFVLHALNFLEPGGRIAWVLPGSVLRANYAKHLKDVLRRSFSAATLFHVHERLFTPAGVAEESVVLVAEGFRDPDGCRLEERSVETVPELADQLKGWGSLAPMGSNAAPSGRPFKFVADMDGVPAVELEKLLTARIGAVTGDNPFFLFSKQRAEEEGIDVEALQPVFAKGGMTAGLSFGKPQLRSAAEAGLSFFLLSLGEDDEISEAIQRYLAKYPKDRIVANSTFRKRRCWHQTNLAQVPHAFWPVMRDLGPKLVLNPQKIHCTNTVHKIFFVDSVSAIQRKQIAITLQCTYAQLHAEMSGRSYGSGVLKHEPRDVGRIRIPWPEAVASAHTTKIFDLIDAALRRSDHRGAMDLADGYVRRYLGKKYSAALVSTLKRDLEALRRLRMPSSRRSAIV